MNNPHTSALGLSAEPPGGAIEFQFHKTILHKYNVSLCPDPTNPWTCMCGMAVDPKDLATLVLTFELVHNHRVLKLQSETRQRHKRVFICTSCRDFRVVFERPVNKKGTYGPLFLVEASSFPIHTQRCPVCPSIPNKDVLVNLPLLVDYWMDSSLAGNGAKNLDRKSVESFLASHSLSIDGISRAQFYNARITIERHLQLASAEAYCHLARYLRLYHQLNPSAAVALQLDSEGRFFRMFVSIPNAKRFFEKYCMALFILQVMKLSGGGKLLFLNGQDGNGKSVPLAIGWVPPSVSNLHWFVDLLKKCGLPMDRKPVFTDPLLATAGALSEQNVLSQLSLKYDLEYLERDVIEKFSITKKAETKSLLTLLSNLQATPDTDAFFRTLNEIAVTFSTSSATTRGYQIVLHLLSIHPTHYTVWGNRPEARDESTWFPQYKSFVANILKDQFGYSDHDANVKACSHIDTSIPVGRPHPLFNTCRVAEEGEAFSSVRSLEPPAGVKAWVKQAAEVLDETRKEYTALHNASVPITAIGNKVLQTVRNIIGLRIIGTHRLPSGGRLVVVGSTDSETGQPCRHSCLLTERGVQCDCAMYHMMRSCPHCTVAAKYDSQNDQVFMHNPESSLWTMLPAAFIASSPVDIPKIELPESMVIAAMDTPISTLDTVLPPPLYRSSLKRMRSTADELGEGNVQSSPRQRASVDQNTAASVSKRPPSPRPFTNIATQEHGSVNILTEPSHASELPNVSAVTLQRRHCSECGSEGHTIRSCEAYLSGSRAFVEAQDLHPGRHIVYKLPTCTNIGNYPLEVRTAGLCSIPTRTGGTATALVTGDDGTTATGNNDMTSTTTTRMTTATL